MGAEREPHRSRAPRVVLVLPSTTYRATDFLDAARTLGAEVVVASDAGQALGDVMGAGALHVPVDDPDRAAERIADHATTGAIDAVIGVDDRGVRAATAAAARLGLPHNPDGAIAATARKDRQRRALAAGGVVQPDFEIVGSAQRDWEPEDVAAAAERVGLPCVVKPVTRSGSQGVVRADTADAAVTVARRVRAIVADAGDDPTQPLLVEAFAPGAEVAVEGLLRRGELEILAVFDKPHHPDGPTYAETLYVTPSRLPPPARAELERTVASAAAALGLREGPVHAEARVDLGGDEPVARVLELAARSIGGLCSRALRFGAGHSLEELVLRHALDADDGRRARRELAASGVLMLPIPARGTLVGVDGLEEARAVPGVDGVELTIGPGQEVVPVPEGDRYLGFAFARGATPDDVVTALDRVQRTVVVRLRDTTTGPVGEPVGE